jgi:hypothetical protein
MPIWKHWSLFRRLGTNFGFWAIWSITDPTHARLSNTLATGPQWLFGATTTTPLDAVTIPVAHRGTARWLRQRENLQRAS